MWRPVAEGCGCEATLLALLTAIDPSDNSVRWNFVVGYMRACQPPVVASDGTVFTTTPPPLNSQTAVVVAVNPDGSQKWRYEEGNTAASWPALSTDETQVYAGVGNRIIAFDAQTGAIRWTSGITGAVYVRQVVVDWQDRVFVTGNDGFSAFTNSGTLLWWRGWQNRQYFTSYPSGRLMLAEPTLAALIAADDASPDSQIPLPTGYRIPGNAIGIVDRDGIAYLAANNLNNPEASGLLALAPPGLRWRFETGDIGGMAMATDGTLIFVSGGVVYALGP